MTTQTYIIIAPLGDARIGVNTGFLLITNKCKYASHMQLSIVGDITYNSQRNKETVILLLWIFLEYDVIIITLKDFKFYV